MKVADFFDFGSRSLLSTFRAPPELEKGMSGEECLKEIYSLIRGNYEELKLPIICKQREGKKLTDILDTGYASLYLISNRLKKILEENHFTGWKTFPIKLYDKDGNEILGYQGFSITGCCGPVDWNKSEEIEKQRYPGGPLFKAYKGYHIGLEEWDGTDFFLPDNSNVIVTTKKVTNVLKKNKITNVEFVNLAEWEKSW